MRRFLSPNSFPGLHASSHTLTPCICLSSDPIVRAAKIQRPISFIRSTFRQCSKIRFVKTHSNAYIKWNKQSVSRFRFPFSSFDSHILFCLRCILFWHCKSQSEGSDGDRIFLLGVSWKWARATVNGILTTANKESKRMVHTYPYFLTWFFCICALYII